MATPITNYTTYDLAYYYADLMQLPRFSNEERQRLVSSLSPSSPLFPETLSVKHQLIESYLPLAKYFAIELCHHAHYHRRLPDLIGEANLTLVETVHRADLSSIHDLTSYFVACIQGGIHQAIANDGIIKVSSKARKRAKEQRTYDTCFQTLDHVISLDERMEWYDTDELEEPKATSILPTEQAPERDAQQHARTEMYLSYLSPRAQAILRLRYGLDEDNEHAHTYQETASLLGIKRAVVVSTERDALKRLRAFAEGQATLGTRKGRACICTLHSSTSVTLAPEQEVMLQQAYTRLSEQQTPITECALANATQMSIALASTYLRLRMNVLRAEVRTQQRIYRLEQAWTQLQHQGGTITCAMLAKAAHVRKPTAKEFLTARRSENYATK